MEALDYLNRVITDGMTLEELVVPYSHRGRPDSV